MDDPESSKIKWQPYSQASFDSARLGLKPLIMLISAKWCRECRAYEGKTLESEDISRNINKHLVPIYVDADKRPDILEKYISGGLPTTVLLDYNGNELVRLGGILNGSALMALMEKAATEKVPKARVPAPEDEAKSGSGNAKEFLFDFESRLAMEFDELYGGFGQGEKFPNTHALDYLAVRYAQNQKNFWKTIVERSLRGILRLKDKAGGGYFRYASSRDWEGAHNEKMLCTNAEIADAMLKSGKVLENGEFLKEGESALEWMLEELNDAKTGGFYGSRAAASERYFETAIKDRKAIGNPETDTTKYCAWNAQAAIAFLHGHRLLNKLRYWEVADRALGFMASRMLTENGMHHYFNETEGGRLDGLLLDNAWAAVAFFEAYRIGKQEEHKGAGVKLLEYMISRLYSKEKGAFMERNSKSAGMFRDFENKSSRLAYRGNAVACWALALGYNATQRGQYLNTAKDVAGKFIHVHDDLDATALMAQVALNIMGND
ncbi:MAG: DUF255 domain-containing protein [Candidatus Micrarchaeota archaeon]